MNIDDLKNNWHSLNTISSNKNDPMVREVVSGKISSARERLLKQYRTFSIIAPILCIAQFGLTHLFPLYIIIYSIIYFAIAGMMDYSLYKGIKTLDLSTESVTHIATKAKFYRRRHHQCQLILLPMAVILICLYFSSATGWQQIGIVVGIIIGMALGLPTYLRIMRDYKQLSNKESSATV
jgi:hypothetical protein